ncbi:MAG: phage terminase small subunit P27 family [Planctomycetota bacterium]
MATRGPKPRPKKTATSKTPTCPRSLTGTAATVYKRLCKLLEPRKILTEEDRDGLMILASSLNQYAAAERHLNKHGLTTDSPRGGLVPSPMLAVQRAAWDRCKQLLPEFGLTPSARVRMGLVPDAEDEEDDGFDL